LAWDTYIPYLTGAVAFALGVATLGRKGFARSRGLDKVVTLARLAMAVPLAVFAGDHFASAESIARIVPSWIPGHLFWVYFVGVCLFAAALSLAVEKYAALAAALFGIMLLLFEPLISIPAVLTAPSNRILWAVALRDLCFSGGALSFAIALSGSWKSLLTVTRLFIAVPILFFAVEHFLHPEFAPGVPLALRTPEWIPIRLFWGYATGAVFLITGLSLLANRKTRLAATWLGLIILVLCLAIYLPIVISKPSDIGNGLNYLMDTLLLSGAAIAFAASQPDAPRSSSGHMESSQTGH